MFVSNRPTRTCRIVRPEQGGNHNLESSDEHETGKGRAPPVSIRSPEPSSSSEREKNSAVEKRSPISSLCKSQQNTTSPCSIRTQQETEITSPVEMRSPVSDLGNT